MLSNNVVIVGAGSHARAAISIARESKKCRIIGILDWACDFDASESVAGVKVLGCLDEQNSSIVNTYKGSCVFFVGIGDNKIRQLVFNELQRHGVEFISLISCSANIASDSTIHKASIVGIGAIVNTHTVVLENSIINSGSTLEHDVLIGAHCHIGPRAILCGSVNVGDGVLVGAGSIILPKIEIASGVKIGAGSIVTKNIMEANSIYLGAPARRVS